MTGETWKRPWIKVWVEMLDDPKYLDLTLAQQAVWVNLLLVTTRSPQPGRMLRPSGQPMSLEHLRAAARAQALTREEFQATLRQMESMEMVHWEEETLVISHWHDRQAPKDATAAERKARERARKRLANGHGVTDVTAGVTPPVTEGVRDPGGGEPGPVTEVPGPVTPKVTPAVTDVTERRPVTGGVTEVAGLVTPEVTPPVTDVTAQEEERGRGVGLRPTRRPEGEKNPSGAMAPSGPAANSRHPLPASSRFESPGGPEFSAAAGPGEERRDEDSAPFEQLKGSGAQRPPRAMTGRASLQDSGNQTAARTRDDSRAEGLQDPGEAADRVREEPAQARRRKTGGNPQVDGVLQEVQALWGQPIVHWAKEAREVKAALDRGYTPEQIVGCWKAAQESPRWQGQWIPLAFLVEDLGEFVKNGHARKWGGRPGKETRATQSKSVVTAEELERRPGW